MKHIAFVGCRPQSWPAHEHEYVQRFVRLRVWNEWHDAFYRVTYISGGASGVDSWAEEAFDEIIAKYPESVSKRIFQADWDTYGKSAGYRRNELIVAAADKVIAFWDGESRGTKHTIDLALKNKVHLEVVFL